MKGQEMPRDGEALRVCPSLQQSPRGSVRKEHDVWRVLTLLASVGVGLVFIASGVLKLVSLPAFLFAIEGFLLVPKWVAPWLAVTLPWMELLCGLCVAAGFWREAGATLIFAMLVVFTGAALWAIGVGLDIECGCFGLEASSKVGLALVGRNTALIVLTMCVLWKGSKRDLGQETTPAV